jgi:hypothetical protein
MATHPAHTLPHHPAAPTTRLLPRPAQLGRDALYLLSGLPAGIVTFTVLVTGIALAAGLLVTLLGIPVLLGLLYAVRALGDVERHRAAWLLGTPVTRSTRRPWRGGIWQRTKAACADGGAWRDATWSLLLLPLGIAGFTAVVALWSAALGLVASPLWYLALPQEHQDNATLRFLNSHDLTPSLARLAAGLVLIPVAAWGCRALADGTARAARALLQN